MFVWSAIAAGMQRQERKTQCSWLHPQLVSKVVLMRDVLIQETACIYPEALCGLTLNASQILGSMWLDHMVYLPMVTCLALYI